MFALRGVFFSPGNKVELLILQFTRQNNGNATMKVDAMYILVGKVLVWGEGSRTTTTYHCKIQELQTWKTKWWLALSSFSQHMCLVHFTRAYITHVCKDCITASQGSLWINQQHVASQGLWTHVSIESPLIWQARSSRRGGTAATGDVVQQTCPWLRCSCLTIALVKKKHGVATKFHGQHYAFHWHLLFNQQ